MDKNTALKFLFILSILIFINLPNAINGFGFDSASSSCSQKISRRGRAQLLQSIPCNLSQQSYCNLPGSSYPWHAVRRFVHENQGLMKRMYGDVHHISVLRNEIQNNDIDMEGIGIKERSNLGRQRKMSKYLHSDYQNPRTNEVLTEPHFRQTSSSSSTTTTTSTTSTTKTTTSSSDKTKTSSTSATSKKDLVKETKQYQHLDDIDMDDDDEDGDTDESIDLNNNSSGNVDAHNNFESNSVYEVSSIKNNIKIVKPPNLQQKHSQQQQQQYLNKSESSTISTILKIEQNLGVKGTGIESPLILTSSSDKQNKAEIPRSDELLIQKIQENIQNVNESLGKKQSIEPPNATRPLSSTEINENGGNEKKKGSGTIKEGQLFQDTVHKDLPTTNFRGVNACPVKEEVVAPFWANNTRGEVLALLNLYPFEQYVHWERCTNEHKQMFCRDGCRCEQQYSLHRLLAYDPRDECRGIFSDWFRFPSCCVCKCYNIPLEFRATSRSPRSDSEVDERNPIDLAEAEVHRAIYEHATEDWYRPRDEFDLNYDYMD